MLGQHGVCHCDSANALNIVVAPSGELVYAGAISDNPTMDAKEARAARNYVKAALEDLAAGRKVPTSSTRPFGCTIAYSGR